MCMFNFFEFAMRYTALYRSKSKKVLPMSSLVNLFLKHCRFKPVLFKIKGDNLNMVSEHKSESNTAIIAWNKLIKSLKSSWESLLINVETSILSPSGLRVIPTKASTSSIWFRQKKLGWRIDPALLICLQLWSFNARFFLFYNSIL